MVIITGVIILAGKYTTTSINSIIANMDLRIYVDDMTLLP